MATKRTKPPEEQPPAETSVRLFTEAELAAVEWSQSELAALGRARRWLCNPRRLHADDAHETAARSALVELRRALDPVPQPPAEPDPPIAATLGEVPAWVRTGDTGMFPVLARRTLGLIEEDL